MSTTRLKIAKLAGAMDAEHIEQTLESVPGVKSVTIAIEPETNAAVVEHGGADEGELTSEPIGNLSSGIWKFPIHSPTKSSRNWQLFS